MYPLLFPLIDVHWAAAFKLRGPGIGNLCALMPLSGREVSSCAHADPFLLDHAVPMPKHTAPGRQCDQKLHPSQAKATHDAQTSRPPPARAPGSSRCRVIWHRGLYFSADTERIQGSHGHSPPEVWRSTSIYYAIEREPGHCLARLRWCGCLNPRLGTTGGGTIAAAAANALTRP